MNMNDIFMYWNSLGSKCLVRIKGKVVNIYIFGKREDINVKNFKKREVAWVTYKYKFRPKFLYKLYKVMM